MTALPPYGMSEFKEDVRDSFQLRRSVIGSILIPVHFLDPTGAQPCGPSPHCYHELMNIRRFARFAAWTGLALIVLVTILPIGARPSTVTTTDLDRALAFIVMSGLFIIAYPRRALAISLSLLFAAFLIELTQFASVTRHPQMHDAVFKALGVMVGVIGGFMVNLWIQKCARAGEPRKKSF
jgi:hypothetical protein